MLMSMYDLYIGVTSYNYSTFGKIMATLQLKKKITVLLASQWYLGSSEYFL